MQAEFRARVSMKNPVHFLALGFGSGLIPFMPGTFGSLAALPLLIACSQISLISFIALTLIFSVVGIYLCGKTADDMQVHDHGSIVWDEIAGMFVTFLFVPISASSLLVGFVLFRLTNFISHLKKAKLKKMSRHLYVYTFTIRLVIFLDLPAVFIAR